MKGPESQTPGISAEILQLIETNKRKLWHKWLRVCLFIQDIDPYALFKAQSANDEPSKQRHSLTFDGGKRRHLHKRRHFHTSVLYQSDELRLPHSELEHLQWKVARFLKVYSVYFYAKMILVSISQYTLLKYEYPKGHSEPLLSFDTASRLAQNLGNPIQSLKDSALLIYGGPPGYLFFFAALLPTYYWRYPMDNAPLRFLLEPRHELRKIDACIRFKLAKVRASFEIYKWQRLHKFSLRGQGQLARGLPGDRSISSSSELLLNRQLHRQMQRREERFCNLMQRHLEELNSPTADLSSFRPRNFSLEYYVEISSLIQPTVWSSTLLYSVCILIFLISIWIQPYIDRCPSWNCNVLRVYSGPEMLLFLELLITMSIGMMISALNLILISLITTNQLNLIESFKEELAACRSVLEGFNQNRADRGEQLEVPKRSCEPGEAGGSANAPVAPANQDELDRFMLRALVKLFVCDDELANNTRCLSMEVLNPFYYALGIIFIFIMNGQFRVPETYFIRNFVLVVSWLNVNMIAISCAHINSKVLDFKRKMWSILAFSYKAHQDCYKEWQMQENQQHQQRPTATRFSLANQPATQRTVRDKLQLKCCSFIADMWIKFIHSSVMNRERHCPRLFFVEFSYQGLIEANFFAIFVWSFSTQVR